MSARDQADKEVTGNQPARLRILDKEVQIACKPGEEDDLMQAAAYVDRSMRDLRKRNTTSSIEKIAIVTAINTAHALLKSRSQEKSDDTVMDRVSAINAKLDQLLSASTSEKKEPE
ncbi:MAG: cell division protein ZapA [Granulosicoccus sp.]|nr:cell division protein ZapA [Granulosicoccus sp.]